MSKKNKGSVLNILEHERHRVAATLTREQAWEHPEPNSGLARMFVIMLLIHVFVIGGIIIYDFIGGDSSAKSSQGTASSTAARSSNTGAGLSSAPLPTIASTSVPSSPKETKPAPALSVPQSAPALPKAVPYAGQTGAAQAKAKPASTDPIIVARASTQDPSAFRAETASDTETTPPAAATPPASRPAGSSAEPSKPKQPEKTSPSYQPKPVPTPSAARRALADGAKPPAPATTKKKDKEASDPFSTKKTAKSSGSKHTLTKGDTIYSLSRHFKVSEETLMKLNGIKNPNALTVGKVITIPPAK